MTDVIKGSFELMKKLNVEAVLNVIKINGSLSRADIAKLTALTPASVTNITKFLIDNEYLIESRIGESSGGRPPIILEINMKARYVLGIYISIGFIEVVLTDLNAEVIFKRTMVVEKDNTDESYIFENLIKLINEVIECSEVDKGKIAGIGVAMHGIVNPLSGVSEYAPYYKWNNVNIRERLKETFDYEVLIDNDVRAMALGESMFGAAKNVENFITINVSNGIGAGIIIDNKPYYGVDYSAGEIGHIVVEQDGVECKCGNNGCLETVASNTSIVEKVIRDIREGAPTLITDIAERGNGITIEDIVLASLYNDELAVKTLKEAAGYIGIGISNLVNILNPNLIVMVGEVFDKSDYMIDTIKEVVKRRGLRSSSERVKIVRSKLGKNAAVVGAAALVIQEVFKGREFI